MDGGEAAPPPPFEILKMPILGQETCKIGAHPLPTERDCSRSGGWRKYSGKKPQPPPPPPSEQQQKKTIPYAYAR